MSYSSSQIYYVNSINRLSGVSGNFTYAIQLPPLCDFDRVAMLSANVPVSYYVVPAGYNTFVLSENISGVVFNATVTVPVGNYNASSFTSIILPLINAASPNHWTYSMSFPSSFSQVQTGKFTWTVTGPVSPSYSSFIFTTSLFEQMGFEANSSNSFTSNTLVSQNVVNFMPESSILVHSDIVGDGTDVLQEIFNNNASQLSNVTFDCPDVQGYSKKMRTNSSNVYTFTLTDEHGRTIDLNGVNVLFTLVLFKRDNISQIIKSYLKNLLSSS